MPPLPAAMPPVRSHFDAAPRTGLQFVYFDLQSPDAENRTKLRKPDRDAVREELRAEWNEELSEYRVRVLEDARSNSNLPFLVSGALTGVPDASLWWTTGTFSKRIVWKLGYTWAGWPAHIPFDNLSYIPGGDRPLEELKQLWKSGQLRLVPATAEERERALYDPESVIPNARPEPAAPPRSFAVYRRAAARLRELSQEFPPPPPRPQPVERVLHPLSELKTAFVLPLDDSSTALKPSCARRQRSDINLPRARPVTHRKPKHPKRGPHTALTFVGAASGFQSRYVFSDDRLEQHVAVDEYEHEEAEVEEIESADDLVWV